ncbi:MAG: DUF4231 domain-containing protein [Acetobacteraceae bacterium]|nr:DUF4231 domain-containing protein [Acetobacteraceae bacterium]
MLELAWDEYRGWALRARSLQAEARRWNSLAMGAAVLAALFGAAAGQAPSGSWLGRVLAFAAAVAAGLTAVLGRDMLDARRRAGWIRARATAEAIKSECFRFAAGLEDYGREGAGAALSTRLEELAAPALREGLTPLADPARDEDPHRPSRPMQVDWYIAHRLREQRDYYAAGQRRHERTVARSPAITPGLAITAVILGAAGSAFGISGFGPWIGVITTVGTLVVAQGSMERSQFLAATYGAMVPRLSRIEARYADDLINLVAFTEDLLAAEHGGWAEP